MKKTAKILTLIVAAVLMVAMVAGCGGKDDAEKTVKAYCDAVIDADFEKVLDYLDEDSDAYEVVEDIIDHDGVPSVMTEGIGDLQGYEEDYKELMKKLVKKSFKIMEYKIEKVEEDGDEATVTISAKGNFVLKDFGDVSVDTNDDAFSEAMNERMQKDAKKLQGMSEKEQIEWSLEALEEVFDEVLEEKMDEVEEEEQELKLKKIDGKWKIVD